MTATQLIILLSLHTHFYYHHSSFIISTVLLLSLQFFYYCYSSSFTLFGYFFISSFDCPALVLDLLCSSPREELCMVLFEECLALHQCGGAVEGELRPEHLFLLIKPRLSPLQFWQEEGLFVIFLSLSWNSVERLNALEFSLHMLVISSSSVSSMRHVGCNFSYCVVCSPTDSHLCWRQFLHLCGSHLHFSLGRREVFGE